MTGAAISQDVLARLKEAAGPNGWLEAAADRAPYLTDERDLFHGEAPLVLRPNTTDAVAAIVKICADAAVPIVPQGGNTGYCGGSIPGSDGGAVVLSLSRMNRIRDVDPLNYTITVEAGCVLKDIQDAADAADRLFPLSLAAEGTCQIGGNISTNAGGTAVLRYGNTRDLVLGIEAVLPDGRVWNGLRRLRKDNTGYDLKQLFIGAEGTLGIVTAAVCKLFPRPRENCTLFAALKDSAAMVRLLARFRAATGDGVTSFEYIHRQCLDLVFAHIADTTDPFADTYIHYALVELSSGRDDGGIAALAEAVLAEAYEAGEVLDATIAQSGSQAAQLWRLRETIPEAQKHAGGCIKHDVSVPVSAVPEFLARATAAARDAIADVRVAPFGHAGDGNVHFNLTQPLGADKAAFLAETHRVETIIHDIAMALDGSFSAEHGVGVLKKHELARYKSETEIALMAKVRAALDPGGLMNPGKVL